MQHQSRPPSDSLSRIKNLVLMTNHITANMIMHAMIAAICAFSADTSTQKQSGILAMPDFVLLELYYFGPPKINFLEY